jgi:DNA-3-methyladenine glycosylase II
VADRIDATLVERARRILRRRDPILGDVIRSVGICALRRRGDPYRFLVRSILYQQISGHAARAIEGRLHASFGGRVPEPAQLRKAATERLRAAGLSRQKVESLRAIATAFDERVLDGRRLARMPDDDVVAAVTQVRGVGEWTAHMLLMFSLGRPDVLPVGDYGVRKAARDLYDLADLPKRVELEALGEPWRPYRSVATWYLWRSTEIATP